MIVRKHIDITQAATPAQVHMLMEAANRPNVYDEDCPELTDEELLQFSCIAQQRKDERRKQTVTLRLSPMALHTAKSLGKGYTSVLSRILEAALTDKEVIQKFL